jgi:hypothetical protein
LTANYAEFRGSEFLQGGIMEFTSASDPSSRYVVIPPFFINNDLIGVLDGKSVLGSVTRRAVTSIRVENRSSFKHPIVGTLVGAAMVVVSTEYFLPHPEGAWWFALNSPLGSLFLLFCGCFLLWGVLRRRDEPWIVFVTDSGERDFPIKKVMTAEAVKSLLSVCGSESDALVNTMAEFRRNLA